MNNKTLFVDFDGVLRIWSTDKIGVAEEQSHVEPGTVLNTAFANSLLHSAVTGKISHVQWQGQVEAVLAEKYGPLVSSDLISAWENELWEIDNVLLNELVRIKNAHQLVLVTNATDKLNSDLAKCGLKDFFSFVVNSSSIGIEKPNLGFFQRALEISGSRAQDSVFVDDSLSHVESASRLGIASILHKTVKDTVCFVEEKCT